MRRHLTYLISLAFIVSPFLGVEPSSASSIGIDVTGDCSPSLAVHQGDICYLVVSASLTDKGRQVRLDYRGSRSSTWLPQMTVTLDSRGQKRISVSDACTYPAYNCAGLTSYRAVMLESSKKAQTVSSSLGITFVLKSQPPVNLPKDIPNQPSPQIQLSSDGGQLVLVNNNWDSGVNTTISWFQGGSVIAGEHSDSIRLTKSMSNQPIKAQIFASQQGFKSVTISTNSLSTTLYPISTKSSVRQSLVDGLAYYCDGVSNAALNVTSWTLLSSSFPYTLYGVTSGGIIYVDITKVNSGMVQIGPSAQYSNGVATQAFAAWGCPQQMSVLIR